MMICAIAARNLLASAAGIAILGTLLLSPSHAQMIGSEEDIAEIKAFIQSAEDAYVERDWDRFADHFTVDGLWMPNNRLPLRGKSAWWSYVGRGWDKTRVVDMNVHTDEIIVSGGWAMERHTQATKQVREGETIVSRSKGVWILKRTDDGSWKIARYIWNRNPAPEE